MDIYVQAALKIIQQQMAVIGPLAVDQAKKVPGVQVVNADDLKITGNGKDILGKLVSQYEKLFGRASVEVCRDAVKEMHPPIPADQLPAILQ